MQACTNLLGELPEFWVLLNHALYGYFQKNRYTKSLISGLPTLLANKMRKLNVD
jgi:hypothetical protein